MVPLTNRKTQAHQVTAAFTGWIHINDTNQVLMVSVRLRKRAVPVAWCVRSTQGNIGFSVQKELLDSVRAGISESISVLLAGDRFYGTDHLIMT